MKGLTRFFVGALLALVLAGVVFGGQKKTKSISDVQFVPKIEVRSDSGSWRVANDKDFPKGYAREIRLTAGSILINGKPASVDTISYRVGGVWLGGGGMPDWATTASVVAWDELRIQWQGRASGEPFQGELILKASQPAPLHIRVVMEDTLEFGDDKVAPAPYCEIEPYDPNGVSAGNIKVVLRVQRKEGRLWSEVGNSEEEFMCPSRSNWRMSWVADLPLSEVSQPGVYRVVAEAFRFGAPVGVGADTALIFNPLPIVDLTLAKDNGIFFLKNDQDFIEDVFAVERRCGGNVSVRLEKNDSLEYTASLSESDTSESFHLYNPKPGKYMVTVTATRDGRSRTTQQSFYVARVTFEALERVTAYQSKSFKVILDAPGMEKLLGRMGVRWFEWGFFDDDCDCPDYKWDEGDGRMEVVIPALNVGFHTFDVEVVFSETDNKLDFKQEIQVRPALGFLLSPHRSATVLQHLGPSYQRFGLESIGESHEIGSSDFLGGRMGGELRGGRIGFMQQTDRTAYRFGIWRRSYQILIQTAHTWNGGTLEVEGCLALSDEDNKDEVKEASEEYLARLRYLHPVGFFYPLIGLGSEYEPDFDRGVLVDFRRSAYHGRLDVSNAGSFFVEVGTGIDGRNVGNFLLFGRYDLKYRDLNFQSGFVSHFNEDRFAVWAGYEVQAGVFYLRGLYAPFVSSNFGTSRFPLKIWRERGRAQVEIKDRFCVSARFFDGGRPAEFGLTWLIPVQFKLLGWFVE